MRPGTDPAVLAFLIRHVLERGPDVAYLAAAVDPAGVERLRRAVSRFGAEPAAAISGVEVASLTRLAGMLDDAGRVSIETGTGVSMSRSGSLTEWLVWALSAVTGSLDREGGSTFNPGFLRAIENSLPGGRGDRLPPPPSRPDIPRVVNGEMPCAALADEIDSGAIRALIVRVGNPALAIPDTGRLSAALARLDLLVVIDARLNETARMATHVLPMADHFERGDLVTGYLQAKPFLRYAPSVVAPVGERRPQWWIFAELSRRLGLPRFGSARADARLADAEVDDERVAAVLARAARQPWADVRAAPYGVLDDALAPGWLIPQRLPRLLDVAPTVLVDAFAGWTERLPTADQLVFVNRRTPRRYNSYRLEQPSSVGVDAALVDTVFVNPVDAAEHGLSTGDRTTISSAWGVCAAHVEVTDNTRVGVVSLPHGSGRAIVNRLTSTRDVDRLSAMPILSGFAVTLSREPAEESARGR